MRRCPTDRRAAGKRQGGPLHLGPPTAVFHIVTLRRRRRRPLARGHAAGGNVDQRWLHVSSARHPRRHPLTGEELVVEPFARLIERGELIAYRYEGFWEPMDTIKDKQRLDALAESGKAPWRCGTRRGRASPRLRRLMLPLRLEAALGDAPTCSLSARMRTTSRSAARARCSRSELAPQARSLGRVRRRRARDEEARASAAAFPTRARRQWSSTIPRRVLPVWRRGREGRLRGAEADGSPDVSSPTRARPPSGSSTRLRAHLEHLGDHLVLEYEVPKYDGDLGAPNLFVEISEELAERKLQTLQEHFESQHGKRWFTDDVFRAVLRLRGMESGFKTGLAEGSTAGRSCSSAHETAGDRKPTGTSGSGWATYLLERGHEVTGLDTGLPSGRDGSTTGRTAACDHDR